jgi:protein-S-isoprenylcysteine O-methyltransferase Ste14
MSTDTPPDRPPCRFAWPPYLAGGVFIGGLLLDGILRLRPPVEYFTIPGGLIAAGAAAYVLWAVKTLRWHETPIRADKPARTLVTDGPYQSTRNPIYIGVVLAAVGVGLVFGSWGVVMLSPLLGVALHYLCVIPEERHLSVKFGREYAMWAAETPRWHWRNL